MQLDHFSAYSDAFVTFRPHSGSAIVRFGHSRFGHTLYLISMYEETECRSLYFSKELYVIKTNILIQFIVISAIEKYCPATIGYQMSILKKNVISN